MRNFIKQWIDGEEQAYTLRISRKEEAEHIQLLGDPGTGKSQIIHSFLRQIAARDPQEAAIIYDPACEFVEAHFNEQRGDIILNALDRRCPYWSPSSEIQTPTDCQLVAESFFPGETNNRIGSAHFFISATRDIFALMLARGSTPSQLVAWLQDADQIDLIVAGTELAHYIDAGAGNQRGGVLGSLAQVGKTLRLLPHATSCVGEISLTKWARERRGWIFITSTRETRDQLRPLHAASIDLLMKRLMSVDPAFGVAHPCWLIVDEVHALKRLPALSDALAEGRKYGLRIVQGTQNKTQYEAHYGELAKMMLAASHLKILMRCGEPETAEWIAKLIGEEERERPKVSTTASVKDTGRDSINYSTITERRPVVSKEQVMGLADMEGFWKYGDTVVPFRILYYRNRKRIDGFIARPGAEVVPPEVPALTTAGRSLAGDRREGKENGGRAGKSVQKSVQKAEQKSEKAEQKAEQKNRGKKKGGAHEMDVEHGQY